MTQSANHSARQSAANEGRGPQRGCAARPACANAPWRRGATPDGPDHALPGHVLDAAHVSSHAGLLAQRRWGTPGAGETSAGTVGDSQRHAHASADASAAAPKSPAGDAGWLPWLALGGSVAALIGAEAERRRASSPPPESAPGDGIFFIAIALYILAAVLAVLAACLF